MSKRSTPATTAAPALPPAFHEATRRWFASTLGKPTRAQALGWEPIVHGQSTLLLAPTGSGKTLAAFLAAVDAMMFAQVPEKMKRCRLVYVSPLKALAVDIERNLRAPIAGIQHAAAELGVPVHAPVVEIRTGDTPQKDRARMMRTPPDILITTPESLFLILTSKAASMVASANTLIVDEIHSLVSSKRGAHLFVSVERLEALRERHGPTMPLQRIGLSATQRPLDEVARLLVGFKDGKPRGVTVVDAGHTKKLDLRIDVAPLIETSRGHAANETSRGHAANEDADDFAWSGDASGSRKPRSVWPALQAHVLALIEQHRSTMMFVNSRRLAERLANALNEMREAGHTDETRDCTVGSTIGSTIALAHHGSLSREQRTDIEDLLKRGQLPAIVATSSLELGIDIGAVDLVIQVEAPPSVAAGLQRVGRASHQVGGVPAGVFVPKHRADVLACAAVTSEMHAGHVEETFYPRNPLDVLAQQLVAIATEGPTTVTALYDLIRQAAPFADLPRSSFESVLDMLSGRYPSHEFSELRPRLVWDRVRDEVTARPEAKRLVVTNAGTIPDRGLYGVFLAGEGADQVGARRVGELDEEMVFELREGEVFLLGAASWRVEQITLNRVYVTPAPGEPSKMPFWHGDKSGRPQALGEQIGKLVRHVSDHLNHALPNDRDGEASPGEHDAFDVASAPARKWLTKHYPIDDATADCIVSYVRDQWQYCGAVPTDKNVVVERFVDEVGDWRVVVLSPFGLSVHAPWAMAIMHGLRERYAGEIEMHYTDDGIAFRIPACDEPPPSSLFFPSPDRVEELVVAAVGTTSLFAARFRESAGRALLLPKRDPRSRAPLWAQRKRAGDLYLVASKYPSFPLILETYRECLKDVFHLPGLIDILRRVRSRSIRYTAVDTQSPSPFASNVLFAFVGNFMYEGDVPLAERRVQALRVDHAQLRELLGETDMRALLDVDAITEHEQWLQWLSRKARSADELHDMLRGIGECTFDEICARVRQPDHAETWLHQLEQQRRAWPLRLGGIVMWAAVEDAALYRDALGVPLVTGLPSVFLQAQTSPNSPNPPMTQLVARYARSHGPFVDSALSARWGCSTQAVQHALRELVRAGDVVEGAFFAVAPPGGETEYCHAEVLRVLRQRSLSRAQRAVQPVAVDAYARFLLDWHGLDRKRSGIDGLLAVIQQLQGCPIPFSVLESEVLPARVAGYRAWDIDALCASGDVVWRGCESIGSDDGRIALYLAEDEPLLHEVRSLSETHHARELHEQIRGVLRSRGASFFGDITQELQVYGPEALEALWDMVWAGEVANDTLRPLRSRLQSNQSRTRGSRGKSGGGGRRERRVLGHGAWSAVRGQARRVLPGSEGRWSLCSPMNLPMGDRESNGSASSFNVRDSRQTERQLARSQALLERYGVVTKSAAHAEGIAGGFSTVYDVFRSLESSGRVRRGYYIEGLGGLQFALPGADERLRQERDRALSPHAEDDAAHSRTSRSDAVHVASVAHVLAATDPANPYGALVQWPTCKGQPDDDPTHASGPRPQRSAGALVVLYQGKLLAWVNRRQSDVLTFLQDEEPLRSAQARALVGALATLVDDGQRTGVLIQRIDGCDAIEHPLSEHFACGGFRPSGRGLVKVPLPNAERHARG